jgi:CRISPR-associated endonuclease/helicase Cas3
MEIIQIQNTDLQLIEANRCRTFRALPQPLTAQVIWDDIRAYQRKRVIVICNTVSYAQALYKDLEALDVEFELNITLLHSRFLPEHRAAKESSLKEAFAQNWKLLDTGACEVLISTQVIEAGINITCEVMHVQLCPMNSLLQRAGRCARFAGEQGEVFVYRSVEVNQEYIELAEADIDPEAQDNQDKKINFLPYSKETCELTWQVLQTHTNSETVNKNVGFRLEEQWINQVHTQEDSLEQKRRQDSRMEFEQNFKDAVFKGDEYTARNLIRNVDSRSIFTWDNSIITDFGDLENIDPNKLLPFSVPISTLCKAWHDFKKSLDFGTDWIFKRIEAPKDKSETYAEPNSTPITSREFLISSIRILVNPRFIAYDEHIGLQIGIDVFGNGFESPAKQEKQATSQYCYHMDNYVGHLVLMWKCWRQPFTTTIIKNGISKKITYISARDELLTAGGKFIKAKIFPEATQTQTEALFEILVFLAIFTHDLGKLQTKWQQVMQGWQQIAHQQFKATNPRNHLLAHTDYNPENKQQQQALKTYERRNKRPNHAVESAFLAQEILKQSLVPLLGAEFNADTEQIKHICYTVIMATGRHHSAWASGWNNKDIAKLRSIELHPEAQKAITQSWRSMIRFLPQTFPLSEPNLKRNLYPLKELDLNKFENDEVEYFQLYLLIVRALRLCDQRSVQLLH